MSAQLYDFQHRLVSLNTRKHRFPKVFLFKKLHLQSKLKLENQFHPVLKFGINFKDFFSGRASFDIHHLKYQLTLMQNDL